MARINKLWLRLFLIFFVQVIFKSFDQSFPNGPFELNVRSFLFTAFFIGYGYFIWVLASWFNNIVLKWLKNVRKNFNRLLFQALLHLVFGYILVLSFSFLYRYGDLYLFGYEWEGVNILNPELTIGLLGVYLMIIGFDGYFNSQKELQTGLLKVEQQEKENALAQYRALKAQIEPHFLFNNLSVLSSLVYKDADLSSEFIVNLSRTLRYIIEKNEFYLVSLSEEIRFLESYFFLIKTRLDEGISLNNRLTQSDTDTYYIPPATLQMLVENAVNHNKYDPDEPLIITIERDNNCVVVKNNLNLRTVFESSTKQGLKNISKRFELIAKKKIIIENTGSEFIVKLPMLNNSDYERFDF
ncbi:MAG: histidine kinase [Prolixibacteraceae bacterium]|nr:histidine kinase [Prolixibacteraceae bacterium]MBN2774291.1 histidine kinase [Prolixibacteraceae bacterium]